MRLEHFPQALDGPWEIILVSAGRRGWENPAQMLGEREQIVDVFVHEPRCGSSDELGLQFDPRKDALALARAPSEGLGGEQRVFESLGQRRDPAAAAERGGAGYKFSATAA